MPFNLLLPRPRLYGEHVHTGDRSTRGTVKLSNVSLVNARRRLSAALVLVDIGRHVVLTHYAAYIYRALCYGNSGVLRVENC